jgi:hypothetical protein
MSKTKVIPQEIPEHLYKLAALSAKEERTDKMTVLQRWLHQGAELYVMQQVAEGQISKGRAAELLDVSIYDIINSGIRYNLDLGPTDEQARQSRELAKRLSADPFVRTQPPTL